jgi:RNA polymerase sigma-70 factor (ECF subfamily)
VRESPNKGVRLRRPNSFAASSHSSRIRRSEQELTAAIRGGDIAAFEELFRIFHAPLCEVVDSYVRSQDVAEELVQDLFFALWVKRDSLGVPDSMDAYLFTAARNRALQHLRHQSVVRRWTELAKRDAGPGAASVRPTADRNIETDETTRRVRVAIDRLPARTRLALVLRLDHDMSNAEIATAMDITVKGVEKLISKANALLRMEIGSMR